VGSISARSGVGDTDPTPMAPDALALAEHHAYRAYLSRPGYSTRERVRDAIEAAVPYLVADSPRGRNYLAVCVDRDNERVLRERAEREIRRLREKLADQIEAAERRGRQIASEAIVAHTEKHFPKDGNEAQRRVRRHLAIAARVALPPLTLAEARSAQAALDGSDRGESRG
jgi:hypothetical protein